MKIREKEYYPTSVVAFIFNLIDEEVFNATIINEISDSDEAAMLSDQTTRMFSQLQRSILIKRGDAPL